MRSYRKIKQILENVDATLGNKGLLLINFDASIDSTIKIYSTDVNNTISQFDIVIQSQGAGLGVDNPNYAIFPFHSTKWSIVLGSSNVIVYELF